MLLQKNTARTLVDTNVLLRYILNDNPEMNQKASEIMDGNVLQCRKSLQRLPMS